MSLKERLLQVLDEYKRLGIAEQIAFDLDDGVVVNYAKFGDVLSKLK